MISPDDDLHDEVVVFGNPWHGELLGNGTLRTESGVLVKSFNPIGPDTLLVKFDDLPDPPAPTDAEAAAGMAWEKWAILSGAERTYRSLSDTNADLKYSFGANTHVYKAPDGTNFLIQCASIAYPFTITAKHFGVGERASLSVMLNMSLLADGGDGAWATRTYPSPDGKKILVSVVSGDTEKTPLQYVWEVLLSGGSRDYAPTAFIRLLKIRTDLYSVDVRHEGPVQTRVEMDGYLYLSIKPGDAGWVFAATTFTSDTTVVTYRQIFLATYDISNNIVWFSVEEEERTWNSADSSETVPLFDVAGRYYTGSDGHWETPPPAYFWVREGIEEKRKVRRILRNGVEVATHSQEVYSWPFRYGGQWTVGAGSADTFSVKFSGPGRPVVVLTPVVSASNNTLYSRLGTNCVIVTPATVINNAPVLDSPWISWNPITELVTTEQGHSWA